MTSAVFCVSGAHLHEFQGLQAQLASHGGRAAEDDVPQVMHLPVAQRHISEVHIVHKPHLHSNLRSAGNGFGVPSARRSTREADTAVQLCNAVELGSKSLATAGLSVSRRLRVHRRPLVSAELAAPHKLAPRMSEAAWRHACCCLQRLVLHHTCINTLPLQRHLGHDKCVSPLWRQCCGSVLTVIMGCWARIWRPVGLRSMRSRIAR